MTYQTNPRFLTIDHLEGCCLWATACQAVSAWNLSASRVVPPLDILDFSDDNMAAWLAAERADGDIIADDYLQRPQGFVDRICGPGFLTYLGIAPKDYVCGPGEFAIDYLFNPDSVTVDRPAGFHHFVVGFQSPGVVVYDPINYSGQISNTARAPRTFIESKRLFRLAQI